MTGKQLKALELGRQRGLKRNRPSGLKYVLIKENPTSFRSGDHRCIGNTHRKGLTPTNAIREGEHLSPGTEFKSRYVPWNKGGKHMPDDKHPMWKGDKVGYQGIHSWIRRKLGLPSLCERCGTSFSKRFNWHNISRTYSRNLNDWMSLCARCHAHEHSNWEKNLCVA